MKLRDFIKGTKTLVEAGAWSDKRMPKTGGKFPLSKARSFRVGAPGWRWRVLQVECGGKQFRILIMYHAGKENYLALVGHPVGSDLLILGCLENHSTHRGWHIHASCQSVATSDSGRLRYPAMRRVASGSFQNGLIPFPSGDDAADEIAARYLKLPPLPAGPAVQIPMTYPPETRP